MGKHLEYINIIKKIIEKTENEGNESIEKAAEILSETLISGKRIFLFGTGHSHMLSEELFYRAGGLVNIQPIFSEELMLHISASKSTFAERRENAAQSLFESYEMTENDTIIIISNSGRNGVVIDMALICKERGLKTIALTSSEHTFAGDSRHKSGKRLCEITDLVLDNFGCVGDAAVEINGLEGKICPTSTVIGALILNSVVARSVELCIEQGFYPDHFASSNIDGGDEINNRLVEKYKKEIKHL